MKVEMDTITVLVITFVYLESIIFISRIAMIYNVFSNVMLMMSYRLHCIIDMFCYEMLMFIS